jgi:hypothetical protein
MGSVFYTSAATQSLHAVMSNRGSRPDFHVRVTADDALDTASAALIAHFELPCSTGVIKI